MDVLSQAFEDLLANALIFLPRLVTSLVIFLLSLIAAGFLTRALRRAMQRRETDPELILLLSKLLRWGTVILGITIALEQIDFDLSAFIAGLGIVGFTVGFALQDVSKNFISGLLLLIQQPFDIGDSIEVAGFSGTVTAIELRATELFTFDGRHVLIPNADVFTSPIVNLSRTDRRRIMLSIGVGYESDLDEVQEVALRAIGAVEGVLADPPPAVVFETFGASSIDFSFYYWIDIGRLSVFSGTAMGVKAIKGAFAEAGINIPYPIQHVINVT